LRANQNPSCFKVTDEKNYS